MVGRFIGYYGFKIHDDIVTIRKDLLLDPLTPVPMVERHDVTKVLLEKKLTVILPYARSLEKLDSSPKDLQVKSLLVTSANAFGETELSKNEVSKDKKDLKGPLHLAYAISRPANDGEEVPLEPNTITTTDSEIGEPVAVVVGNLAFLTPQSLGLAGNLDFAGSSINWLLQTPNLLSIPAKTTEPPFVNLTGDMANKIFYTTVVILPLSLLIIGFIIWLRRRNL